MSAQIAHIVTLINNSPVVPGQSRYVFGARCGGARRPSPGGRHSRVARRGAHERSSSSSSSSSGRGVARPTPVTREQRHRAELETMPKRCLHMEIIKSRSGHL
jgi:hypothetical protein